MKFKIDEEILSRFSGVHVGLVIAKGIDNVGKNEEITRMLREREGKIKEEFNTETLSQNPKIAAWRTAYSSFGAKPKKCKCSVENLYRMVLKDMELRHINKLVDIYNYISLKHIIPAGGDDTDKIEGDISLKFASGEEPFVQLNSEETGHPKPGEVVYVDGKEVLCRRWNWRECDKSKMTEETKNVVLVVEGLPPFSKEDIEEITADLAQLVEQHCGGTIQTAILQEGAAEIEF